MLAWRETQARLEEATLARLHEELRNLHLRIADLGQSVLREQKQLLASQSAMPIEIAALQHFRGSAVAQAHHLNRDAKLLEAKISHQAQLVVLRRRDAQLLEQLKERRFEAWRKAAGREVEQEAEESYLSRFTRSSHT